MSDINPFDTLDKNHAKHDCIRGFEYVKGVDDKFKAIVQLPTRKTAYSAGYDFMCPYYTYIEPGEMVAIKTGIKAYMPTSEYLAIHIRSSMAIKHHLMLLNSVGIIDADYYENPDNDGEIIIAITNIGDEPYEIKQGDYFAQGIFSMYYSAGTPVREKRVGGIGSTGK